MMNLRKSPLRLLLLAPLLLLAAFGSSAGAETATSEAIGRGHSGVGGVGHGSLQSLLQNEYRPPHKKSKKKRRSGRSSGKATSASSLR